ncbi:MAG: DUF4349 domain-containing protein [Bacteroidia bacterium]|nr:DUF4349 domain-containing protein [Bacteroidia bacterium]
MRNVSIFIAVIFIMSLGCSSKEMKSEDAMRLLKSAGTAELEKRAEALSDAALPPPPPASEEYKEKDKNTTVEKAPKTENLNTVQKKDTKKIIKEAEISIEVEKYKEVKASITKTIEKWKGYLSKENEMNDAYKISNSIEIRVPCENFDNLAEDLVKLAKKLDYKRINAKDITDEYYDTKTRLESNKRVEQTYMDLLKKANSIGDILEIQEKLGQMREEIESKEGRLKLMDDKVMFSTITLYFYELHDYKYIPEKMPGFFERLFKALYSGWEGFVTFFIALFYLWPLWLILGAGLYILLRYLRKGKKKQNP